MEFSLFYFEGSGSARHDRPYTICKQQFRIPIMKPRDALCPRIDVRDRIAPKVLQPDLNLLFRFLKSSHCVTRPVERKPVASSKRREIGAKPKVEIAGVWVGWRGQMCVHEPERAEEDVAHGHESRGENLRTVPDCSLRRFSLESWQYSPTSCSHDDSFNGEDRACKEPFRQQGQDGFIL